MNRPSFPVVLRVQESSPWTTRPWTTRSCRPHLTAEGEGRVVPVLPTPDPEVVEVLLLLQLLLTHGKDFIDPVVKVICVPSGLWSLLEIRDGKKHTIRYPSFSYFLAHGGRGRTLNDSTVHPTRRRRISVPGLCPSVPCCDFSERSRVPVNLTLMSSEIS